MDQGKPIGKPGEAGLGEAYCTGKCGFRQNRLIYLRLGRSQTGYCPNLSLEFEVVAREVYTASMMDRRSLRITAYILLFIIGTIAVKGYDVLSGGNITEPWFPISTGCFG